MKIQLILLIILLFASPLKSGAFSGGDSSKIELFPKSYGDKKWKFILGLDARRSFFNHQKIKINGLRIGAQLNGVHRFGIGFYALRDQLKFTNIIVDRADAVNPSQVLLDVSFTTLFYERVFLKTKRWEVSFPFYIGAGQVKTQYLNNLGNYKLWKKTGFSAIAPSFQVKYYLLSWLAPKISFGYRQTYNTIPEVSSAFNKAFYAYGISISLGKLAKAIFNKKDKNQS